MGVPTPKGCASCPAATFSDSFSLDGFDRGQEVYCKFTNKQVDSFYEHPGAEWIDSHVPDWCPLK